MPSEQLKNAYKSDERGLLEMIHRIDSGKISARDIISIEKNAEKNINARFLLATVLTRGAPGTPSNPVNREKAMVIADELIAKHNSSWAAFLKASIQKWGKDGREDSWQTPTHELVLKDLALDTKNPLAVFRYVQNYFPKIHYNTKTQKIAMGNHADDPGINLDDFSRGLKLLAEAHVRCFGTGYEPEIAKTMEELVDELCSMHESILKNRQSESYTEIVNDEYYDKNSNTYFVNQNEVSFKTNKANIMASKENLGKMWVELAGYFDTTKNNDLKYFCYQKAAEIDSKYEKKWGKAVGVGKSPADKIIDILQDYIDVAKKNIDSLKAIPDENKDNQHTKLSIKVMKQSMHTHFNNCKLLYDKYSSKNQDEKLNKVFRKCEIYHETLEREVKEMEPSVKGPYYTRPGSF